MSIKKIKNNAVKRVKQVKRKVAQQIVKNAIESEIKATSENESGFNISAFTSMLKPDFLKQKALEFLPVISKAVKALLEKTVQEKNIVLDEGEFVTIVANFTANEILFSVVAMNDKGEITRWIKTGKASEEIKDYEIDLSQLNEAVSNE